MGNESILVINAGSSSIKFTLFDVNEGELALHYDGRIQPDEISFDLFLEPDADLGKEYGGQVEGIGTAPKFKAKDSDNALVHEETWGADEGGGGHKVALERLMGWLEANLSDTTLLAVGHRVVHGGPEYATPIVVTDEILKELEAYTVLAPLHQPNCLAGIREMMAMRPDLPQVACFDTAFHRNHPLVADQFAVPFEFYEEGVRRYGFHGLSYAYIARTLPTIAPEVANRRVVVAHLGSGASMCAIKGGQSMDSTMGFTALDGLPMGTRCGNLDPGVLLYLLQEKGMDAKQIEDLLYRKAGLLGLSGVSNDMRDLEASDNPRAAQAIDYFVYHINRQLGALAASIGGLDALVFTAGIGENSAMIRSRVCKAAEWMGIELDEAANEQRGPLISTAASKVAVYVIPTDEEKMIALDTLSLLQQRAQ